jgi:hypothetical protein
MSTAEREQLDGAPYEFSPAQNEVIGSLGNSMKWVALPAYVAGTLALFNFIMRVIWAVKTGAYKDWQEIAMLISNLAFVILFLALARWTLVASAGFRAITETQGRDMGFLMLALNELRKMYTVLATFVKVFVAILVLSLILNVISVFTRDRWPQLSLPTLPVPAPAPVQTR